MLSRPVATVQQAQQIVAESQDPAEWLLVLLQGGWSGATDDVKWVTLGDLVVIIQTEGVAWSQNLTQRRIVMEFRRRDTLTGATATLTCLRWPTRRDIVYTLNQYGPHGKAV